MRHTVANLGRRHTQSTHTIDYSCRLFDLPCIVHDTVNDNVTGEECRDEVHLTLEGGRYEADIHKVGLFSHDKPSTSPIN